jgi:hypothetical protein
MLQRILLAVALVLVTAVSVRAGEETWKAGAAKVKITPEATLWMSGYASRTKPAEGTLHDLWAKALVIEDPQGGRIALVTLDLVGIPRDLSVAIRDEIAKKHGLPRAAVCLATSHTHTGPVVGSNLNAMYFLDAAQQKRVDDYAKTLHRKVVEVVGAAIGDLAPAELAWGNGHVTFAVNRRENKEPDVSNLRETGRLKGPVDHDVPVLSVRDKSGKVRAVAFGYACHATVLSFYQWSGDYPGFAQIALEKSHPGAVALFWAGCGADQNPLPRRTVTHAEEYGHRLAQGVDAVLQAPMTAVRGKLAAACAEIDLPFADLPTREQIVKDSMNENRYVAARAKMLLEEIQRGRSLRGTYPYPVQVWQLGEGLTWVTLGGEVVVDYSLRLKKELGRERTWVMGYANDVMAYIPSRRVLNEGGYEGAGAMVYYGLPTVWGTTVEEIIVAAVHEQARKK